jgi:hypothetical protein
MECPLCHYPIDEEENARFCPQCGTLLAQQSSQAPTHPSPSLHNMPTRISANAQALQQHGKPLLGGVPTIYWIANHSGKYHPFHAITQGNNLYYQAGLELSDGLGHP